MLKYIFGGSGYGKTTYCINEMKQIYQNTKNTIIYIVPEQFTLQSEKNITEIINNSITRINVFSFGRLAVHLLNESGNKIKKSLDETGKIVLLRKIVTELSDQLQYYNKSIDKNGFIEHLSKTITEFYQYGVTLDTLTQNILEAENKKQNLALKLHDLHIIFKSFQEYIENKYLSTEQIQDLASDKILGSKILENCHVYIDGFNGFTPQEYKIIEKLLLKSCDTTISLTIKDGNYENIKIGDNYYETKITLSNLKKISLNLGVPTDKPKVLTTPYRFNKSKDLQFLEENYFNYYYKSYKEAPENIQITANSNVYEEVEELAKKILILVRDNNYRYNQIAVVTGGLEDYSNIIRTTFRRFSIPYFIDLKDDILSHPLTEFIRGIFEVFNSNWSYESVFRLLRTNYLDIDISTIDILENFVIKYGIKSYKWKFEKWKYSFNDVSEEEAIYFAKNELTTCIDMLFKDLKTNSTISIRELSTRLFNLLYHYKIPEKIEASAIKMQEENNIYMYRKHSQIWGKIVDVFQKTVEILGDQLVTVSEFTKIVDAGFATTDLGIIPPSNDEVSIGDLERSRLPKISALFILGVNDGVLPRTMKEIGLFTDDERIYLHNNKMALSPDSKRKTIESEFLIYLGITKPEERIYFSYVTGTLSGKVLKPSMLVRKIIKIFPNIEIKKGKEKGYFLGTLLLNELTENIRNFLSGDNIDSDTELLYVWLLNNLTFTEKIDRIENILFTKIGNEHLSKETASKIYGNEIISGVSRLERYMQCPFAYFVDYNLKAKDRQQYDIEPIDIGNVFHLTLEKFTNYLQENNISWKNIDTDFVDELVDKIVDEIVSEIGSGVLESTSRYKYMVVRIKKMASKSIWVLSEHLKAGEFDPIGSELEFKSNSPLKSIEIAINNKQKIILTGRIDRVDIMSQNGNRYIKILDYKSGNKKFDLRDVYFGMQLQLMLYMSAIITNGKSFFGDENVEGKILPGGVFYFNINNPIIEYDGKVDDEKLTEILLKTFKMSGLVLAEPKVIEGLDKDAVGGSNIIPAGLKKDMDIYKNSSVATLEEYTEIMNGVNEKIKDIANSMVEGNINVRPFIKDGKTPCAYCNYKAICKIDAETGNNKYNKVK